MEIVLAAINGKMLVRTGISSDENGYAQLRPSRLIPILSSKTKKFVARGKQFISHLWVAQQVGWQ